MISVVMSVYNERKEWLEDSIDSILAQTYTDFEFIIIIDNPNITDDILLFLQKKERLDNRIRLIRNEMNIGLAMSLNKGIENSKGEYIARMDADDVALPERFEKELFFLKKSNADVVSTNCIIIDDNSMYVRKGDAKKSDPSKELPYINCILHPSVLMKREAFEAVGGYRNFRRSQDYDLWLRMLSNNKVIRILDKPLMQYRINLNSLTNTNRLEQYYTNLYQVKLYEERQKKGFDSYSKENLQDFLYKKHITPSKNKRCISCMKNLDVAKALMLSGDIKFVFAMIKAFCDFPSIVIRTMLKNIKRKIV